MKYYFWIWTLLFVSIGYAQSGSITGIVKDKEMNDEPLPFANAFIKGTSKGTTTDMDGAYHIQGVEPGVYTMVFSFVGYETLEIPNVKVEAGKETRINASLGTDNVSLSEVIVETTVSKESENALLLEQKKAVIAKQAIGAQELSRKGVSDAQGAVTKVSGISKQEGVKSVFVRGLGDRYNATTLNGFPIPSEDSEYKNISLDFFGTDVIQSVGVDKVFTTSALSDVGGATIDISSKELSGNSSFQVDFSAGVNTQVMGASDFYKQDGVDFFGFSNRVKPSSNVNVYDFANSLDPSKQNFLANGSISISGGKKWFVKNNPLSIFGVLSHSSGFSFTDEVVRNATTNGTVYSEQNGKKYSQNINQLGLFNAKYLTQPGHKFAYNLMFIHANDQYVGTYEGSNSETYQDAYDGRTGYLIRQQNNDNLLIVNQLTADWKLSEKSSVEAGASYNYLKGLEPDRRINNFSKTSTTDDYKLTGSTGRQQRVFLTLMENDINTKLAYVHKLRTDTDDRISNIKIGYNGRFVKDDFEAIEYDMQSQQPFKFSDYALDRLYNQQQLDAGRFDLDRNFDSYEVEKYFHSGFAEFTYKVSPSLVFNAGIKAENVQLKVDYNVNRGGTKGSSEITKFYVLPNVNVKYDFNEKNAMRIGASKTYTLPQSKEISPYIYVDVTFKSQGNQDLKPSDNYNFDIKWDYYISSSELFSLTGFYKHVVDPIARVEEGGSGGYLTYKNISKYATIAGVELELRKNIISSEKENGSNRLSFGWNASYIFTELEVDVLNTQKRKSKLEGAAPFITNFDLSYNINSNNRSYNNALVLNYFTDRVYTIGTLQYKDIIEKGIPTLDFVSSTQLTDKLTLKIKAANIFDAERRLTRDSFGVDKKVILNSYKKGVDFSLGLSYKF